MKAKGFWRRFLDYYHIDANKTSLGVIAYDEQPKIVFNLHNKKYQSFKAAEIAIIKASKDRKPGGKPVIVKALLQAHDVLFKLPPRNNKQRLLIVFSGGKSKIENTLFYEDIIRSVEVKRMKSIIRHSILECEYRTNEPKYDTLLHSSDRALGKAPSKTYIYEKLTIV